MAKVAPASKPKMAGSWKSASPLMAPGKLPAADSVLSASLAGWKSDREKRGWDVLQHAHIIEDSSWTWTEASNGH